MSIPPRHQATRRHDSTQPPPDALSAVGDALAAQHHAPRGTAMADVPIRVVLADDHTLFRSGVRALLRTTADIDVVGEATSGTEALSLLARLPADVLVMDIAMPEGDGVTTMRALTEAHARVRVLMLSMHSEEEYLLPLLEAGASGYLTKDAAEQELIEAIRAVAHGDIYVRPRVARLLATHQRTRPQSPAQRLAEQFEQLSQRERSVLELTAQGYGGVEIGQRLGISNKTVETYKERIGEKLGLHHRADYVRFALDAGLLHR